MVPGSGHMASAVADFRRARRLAALQQVAARVTGRPIDLLSYEEVYRKLKVTGSAERGLREIPLDAIVGSVGRTADFTRDFLPRHDRSQERWARVQAVTTDPSGGGWPPINVYQIGEAYFVIDGHHRVSVARQLGMTHIPAYVTEVRTKVPLSPDVSPDEFILKAEYADFLEKTRLDQRRAGADLSLSAPGQIEFLDLQILASQYTWGQEESREIPYEEAASKWYDEVYLPVVQAIREQGASRDFPDLTEADLYLLVTKHRAALQYALGWQFTPGAAATDLASQLSAQREPVVARVGRRLLEAVLPEALMDGPAAGEWRQEKLAARYGDRLFADILVPVSGEEDGWAGLDQALAVAQRERAQLRGLHVVPTQAQKDSAAAKAIQAQFEGRCQAAGIPGSLAVEVGDVTRKICERATLADLVVLHLAYPPSPQPMARLGSGFRTIIRRCPRPVLAVPRVWPPPERALLAYDGSPKAEEALFVAAYLAEAWRIPLVVVTVFDSEQVPRTVLAHAREYLEMHEVEATFFTLEGGPVVGAILTTAEEYQSNLILMGGYGVKSVVEVVLGSSVDEVLRQSRRPLLICR